MGDMTEFKSLLESRTFWGAMVAAGGSALSIGHYTLSAADASRAIELLSQIASAAGALYAIWGRVQASKKISPILPSGPAAAAVIMLAIGAAALWPGHASAQSTKLTQAKAKANPFLVLQQFSLKDLQAALADAQAQTPPDLVAANCYQALITAVQSPAVSPLPASPGLFQLLQKGRDLKAAIANLQSPNGPLTPLEIGCAPLVLDAQTTLIQLGVLTGTVAATGGIVP